MGPNKRAGQKGPALKGIRGEETTVTVSIPFDRQLT